MEPASSLPSPHAMDGHDMGIVKVVNLCTSFIFIFTSGLRREGLRKGRQLWFEPPLTPRVSFGTENHCDFP